MANVIEWIAEKKTLEVYVFYEEVPIKVKIELHDIDLEKEQIIWSFNEKIAFALTKSRDIYFEYSEVIYVMSVIIHDKEEMVTTLPTIAAEPKLKRNYIRVQTSEDDPIYVEIDGISTKVWDISEGGIGIIVESLKDIEIGNQYDLNLSLSGKTLKLKGEIVYIKEINKSNYKVGIKFLKVPSNVEDLIFKYILKRQREILKKLSYFKG
ncbi:MAG: PilZ domain-containing protein [Aquificota bacterium]|nr:MAG: PilZ domain-containing protein [Aquificota bacterium]